MPPPAELPGPFKISKDELTTPGLATSSSTPMRKCVVAREAIVRSGDFVVGWQNAKTPGLKAGRREKIWWVPLHASKGMPPLQLRGRSLTSPAESLVLDVADVAVTSGLGPGDSPKERNFFFPAPVTFSRPGRWLVVAGTGANWGCFVFSVK